MLSRRCKKAPIVVHQLARYTMLRLILCCLLVIPMRYTLHAYTPYRGITVAADGSGDFKTITEALNLLPMFNYEWVVIFIKKGVRWNCHGHSA